MDYAVHGVAKSQTQLSAFHFHPEFRGISSLDPELNYSVCMLSRSVVFDSLQPYGLQSTRLLCPWDALLQVIFPTQGLNWCLLHFLHSQVGSLLLAQPGKPLNYIHKDLFHIHRYSGLGLGYIFWGDTIQPTTVEYQHIDNRASKG